MGEVQYQAIPTKALYESESMAWAGWRAFYILFKVFLIKQIIPVGNKTWCRLYCIQYPHSLHFNVEDKEQESIKDFKEALFHVLDWLQSVILDAWEQ